MNRKGGQNRVPLWNNLQFTQIIHQKNSLQEHKHILKSLKDPLINPTKTIMAKGVSCSAFLSGSVTAETVLVLPLFLFAMVNLLSVFLMFEQAQAELIRLHQTGRQLAVLAHTQAGDSSEPDIRLVSAQYGKPLIKMMGYQGYLLVNGCVMHKWTGYDLGEETPLQQESEEMVYITGNGEAYHLSRGCSYLNPAVEMYTLQQAKSQKNAGGSRYTECTVCGSSAYVYLTKDGERWHASITCSGLKRTVDLVTKKEAIEQGRHVCSRCGG